MTRPRYWDQWLDIHSRETNPRRDDCEDYCLLRNGNSFIDESMLKWRGNSGELTKHVSPFGKHMDNFRASNQDTRIILEVTGNDKIDCPYNRGRLKADATEDWRVSWRE